MGQPIQVFCCYAREDRPLLVHLKKQLKLLEHNGLITVQADVDISPGEDWEQKINHYLNTAQMILLLISPDFMDSDYCYSKEMIRAMERHESGEACVIPIILHPTFWRGAPFGKLQMLPTNAEPVSGDWRTPHAAFLDIASGIEKAVEKLLIQLQPRKIALFGYETQGGNTSILWTDPGVFSLNDNETFLKWSRTKRSLTKEEIVDHTWIKVGDHGFSLIIRFIDGGELFESSLFNPDNEWQGSWTLVDGLLRTSINHNGIYELDILACRDGYMYSGVESQNGMQAANTYFILLPSRKPDAKQEEGKAVRDTKPYDDALHGYDQIIHFNPHCGKASRAKGDILRDLERYEEALAAYERSIEVRPSTRRWYSKGDVLHHLHRFEEALAAFEKAIQLDSKNAKAWHGKGQTLRELQHYEEALAAFGQALNINPNLARSYNEKGNVLFRNLKRLEEALTAYRQATKLDPNYMWAWHNMGNVLETLERFKEALAAYQRAAKLDPNYMWAWHNTGNMLHKFHRYEEALEAYKRTTELDPGYFWAWYNMGDVLHTLERCEEALDAFTQAIERNEHEAVTWREKGKTLQDLERYEEALASYEQALEREPQWTSIWTRKGQVLRLLKRYEEAIAAYDETLKLEANDVDAYLGKGRVYLDLERYNEALAVYEQATNIAPNSTWTWHDKGEALSGLGRTGDALLAFEQAIALDATNKWAWRHKSKALEQLAKQAAQKGRQLFGEKMPIVSEIIDEPTYTTQPNSKGAAIYSIVAESSNKVLDVQKSAQEDGRTALIQYHYHGGLNQQWELVPVEENFFKIVSCFNGEVLDVWMHNREDGAEVVLCPYLGGSNQHWQLILIDSMSFTFKIVSQEIGKVLDVWSDEKEDGTKVVVHRYLGGSNQHWRLINIQRWAKELDAQLIMSLLRHTSDNIAEYLDKVRNRLGLPLTSALGAIPSRQGTTGCVQRFAGGSDDPQGASVYSSKYGTYPAWGWITQCYESCGGTNGRLGFPTSPELDAWASSRGTTGQVQRFEDNAFIYCSRYGAFPTWGGIGRCYENLGGSGGPLGFPTSPETNATPSPQGTDGWVQRFEGGDIYWYCDREYDGVPVREPILSIFEKSGGSGGKFGFPKSPAISDSAHSEHYIQEFEGGVIQSFYQSPV
jgi:tetratricopeptide (TPR) repeat protein